MTEITIIRPDREAEKREIPEEGILLKELNMPIFGVVFRVQRLFGPDDSRVFPGEPDTLILPGDKVFHSVIF